MKSQVRAAAVVYQNQSLLTLLVTDPITGQAFHFLPETEIQEHETAPEAAQRATFEKTKFLVLADPDSCIDQEYVLHWNGGDLDCLTFFYQAKLTQPFAAPHSHKIANNHEPIVWLKKEEIEEKLKYNKILLQTVLQFIN